MCSSSLSVCFVCCVCVCVCVCVCGACVGGGCLTCSSLGLSLSVHCEETVREGAGELNSEVV